MELLHRLRPFIMPTIVALFLGSWALAIWVSPAWQLASVPMTALLGLALYDRFQTTHSVMRNYPLIGRLRYLFESAGPELRQYFVESNTSGRPFNRDQRDLMYRRSKGIPAVKPFGTEQDVYGEGYGFVSHSAWPVVMPRDPARALRVDVGGAACTQPYSASILNVSAMSFGSLSARAILAIGGGAKRGGFAMNTGEGGLSRYHRATGADLIWQIGTGYFGCRHEDGSFDPEQFEASARLEQVKMIELKLSQGAKPGHGGILPAPKVTPEIAEARGVPAYEECVSPGGHTAFDGPTGLLEFIASLRERSGGKPVGFKLCVGNPRDVFSICKAMLETGIRPDFVTVDGAEGGTGAAPTEFSDHVGFPLREGLLLVRNALVGSGLEDEIRVAASGKRMAGFELAMASALGADWCNVARGFMFSVGCIQSQSCHTNSCPVGVATQDPRLQRAIVVEEKAQRAYLFHRYTVEDVAEMASACGLAHPFDFEPGHLFERISPHEVRRFDEIHSFLRPGQLLEGDVPPRLAHYWEEARPDRF
jgi:glutamate synthase domain-containing protein 2